MNKMHRYMVAIEPIDVGDLAQGCPISIEVAG